MLWCFGDFLVILVGSLEMIFDGIFGTERVLSFMGVFYDIITASGDVFAFIIVIAILIFIFRRLFVNVKRFSGPKWSINHIWMPILHSH